MATTPAAPLPERSYPRWTRSTQRTANGLLNPQRRGSTHRTELLAGLTTFVTMAYIIAVNAGILSHPDPAHATGLNFEALVIGTILTAAIPTLVMGLLGALLMEEDEQWSTSHRYLDMRVY